MSKFLFLIEKLKNENKPYDNIAEIIGAEIIKSYATGQTILRNYSLPRNMFNKSWSVRPIKLNDRDARIIVKKLVPHN